MSILDPKYIVFKNKHREMSLVFSVMVNHKTMGEGREITSAGFCKFHVNKMGEVDVKCFGHSESLNIGSIPSSDADVIRRDYLR
jgi:hypothetical protein